MLNPLDYLGERMLSYIPIHFVTHDENYFQNEILDVESWITTKLNGRFSICKVPVTTHKGIEVLYRIGFEDPKELTYFLMSYTRRSK